jgi:prepilin peptidase CpaA
MSLAAFAALYDVKTKKIPNWLNLAGVSAGLCAGVLAGDLRSSLLGMAVGLTVGIFFYAIGLMGGGDAKLFAALGASLGPYRTAAVIAVALFFFVAYCLPRRLSTEGLGGFWEREKASLVTLFATGKALPVSWDVPAVPFAPFVMAGLCVNFILSR